MKYAIYTRTAVKDTKKIQEQEKAIRKMLKKSDTIYRVYKDNGHSGSNLNRPSLNLLRNDAKKGVFDGIFVTDNDRLSRITGDCMSLMSELLDNGLVVKTLTHDFSNIPMTKKLVFNILKAFHDCERASKNERIKGGKRAA